MDHFCEQLASDILDEVRGELDAKTRAKSATKYREQNHPVTHEQRPNKRAKNNNFENVVRKRRSQEEKDIDSLADRLTFDIINHATGSSGSPHVSKLNLDLSLDTPNIKEKKKSSKREPRRIERMDVSQHDQTQIPASDYQKTVINYQNDDECFRGGF